MPTAYRRGPTLRRDARKTSIMQNGPMSRTGLAGRRALRALAVGTTAALGFALLSLPGAAVADPSTTAAFRHCPGGGDGGQPCPPSTKPPTGSPTTAPPTTAPPTPAPTSAPPTPPVPGGPTGAAGPHPPAGAPP